VSASYRPDIDGLRAVAVLSVILYHAGVPGWGGGFVGVDVFFVISGYLITRIIAQERALGQFSVLKFYERRARRILPALFVMMAASCVAAWFLLVPEDMQRFSMSVMAVPMFVSNLLFAKGGGYFDPQSETLPLLHTWSLGVEEQYYLFFPWLVLLLWRWGPRVQMWVLMALAVLSLGLAQLFLLSHPSQVFYGLPTRAWELLAGAVLALGGAVQMQRRLGSGAQAWLAGLGLALLGSSIVCLDGQTQFPGLWALWPVSGAVLLMAFCGPGNAVGRLLSLRPMVGLGLISYSAYLWHQPLLAFARHAGLDVTHGVYIAAVVVATLVMGYVSWRWVEQPFRDRTRTSGTQIAALTLLGSAAFLGLGAWGVHSNGMPARYSQEQREFLAQFANPTPDWPYFNRVDIATKFRFDCDFYDIDAYRAGRASLRPVASISETCYALADGRGRRLLIWGDSHAQQLRPGLDRYLSSEWQILQVASSGCAPQWVEQVPSGLNYCETSNAFAREVMRAAKPEVVILAQNEGHEAGSMRTLADRIRGETGASVVWVGPSPHWHMDLPKLVAYRHWHQTPRYTAEGLNPAILLLDQQLKSALAKEPHTRYASVMEALCTPQGCPIYLGEDRARDITSWDYGHLTPIASELLAQKGLLPLLSPSQPSQ
jgi:peptidoglycan/LPS O-acetylase OafA/YrhL